ncbi:hypothetical protein AAHA92_14680 [Salvia divinorum]|uniref:CCHC-type domain-containing protein n=1 Tax=Salvia divinorum TaxID=28513 RepID=A0ABD1HD28_SALDI
MRCGRCGLDGHNKRTCTNDPRVETPYDARQTSQLKGSSQRIDDSNRAESSNARQNQENNPAGPRRSRRRTTSNPQWCGRRKDKV